MARRIYYVSARPESYELWGEVSREDARTIAAAIVRQAAAHFPDIEFRVSDTWVLHDRDMNEVAAYIDAHWEKWAAAVRARAA